MQIEAIAPNKSFQIFVIHIRFGFIFYYKSDVSMFLRFQFRTRCHADSYIKNENPVMKP